MSNSARLGKGLGALLEDAPTSGAADSPRTPEEISVALLEPSGFQPRHSFDEEALSALAKSIKAQGVLQPLLVRKKPSSPDRYEIIAGERRWRASQQAGLTKVPVILVDLDDGKALEVALVENIQRSDLNPIDEAAGYLRLVNEYNYTHEDMARVTGKSRSHISNLMRLLALPDRIKDMVGRGELSMGHARALLSLTEEESQMRAAQKVVKNGLSVRETERLVRDIHEEEQGLKARRTRTPKDMATRELEGRLAGKLGMPVAISQKDGAGVMKITFSSHEELTGLLNKMGA